MTIAFAGPTTLNQTIGLTPSSPGCKPGSGGTLCTVTLDLTACPTNADCYSGSITTYDAVSCASTCTIPAGAKVLSANQNVAFSVARGENTAFGVTLDGIPASLTTVPGAGSALSGSGSAFAVTKCLTAAQQVSVAGVDVDGNTIVGPGAPSATLTSNDSAHLAVATPAPSASPNAFSLVPPSSLVSATMPHSNTVVQLTAGVTPLSGSGSTTPVSSKIDVTFNTDVCGIITEFSTGITSGASPQGIAAGPDGNIWFAEDTRPVGRIAKITPDGTVTEYSSGISSGAGPGGITSGPDGNLWFTECYGNRIGKITPSGTVTEVAGGIAGPEGITTGPDGNLWVSQDGIIGVGKITTSGSVTEYTSGFNAHAVLYFDITPGPDGNLWFTDCTGYVGKITTQGAVTEYPLGLGINVRGDSITAGPDGNLWSVAGNRAGINDILKITTSGSITTYSSGITNGAEPWGITSGPDGNLWFTEYSGNRIWED
jgi:streptogramin lyase